MPAGSVLSQEGRAKSGMEREKPRVQRVLRKTHGKMLEKGTGAESTRFKEELPAIIPALGMYGKKVENVCTRSWPLLKWTSSGGKKKTALTS